MDFKCDGELRQQITMRYPMHRYYLSRFVCGMEAHQSSVGEVVTQHFDLAVYDVCIGRMGTNLMYNMVQS